MSLTSNEKLKKEIAKANAALLSEKKKNEALKSRNHVLKEENKQLHKQVDGFEGKILRSKQQNVLLKQTLQEELKKNTPLESHLSSLLQDINIQI